MAENPINYEDAGNVLYSQIYVPAFFQKLAEFGLQPQTEEKTACPLRQALMLRHADAVGMTKQMAAADDPLLIAEQRLAQALGQASQLSQVSPETLLKFAAELVPERPELGQAAIAYLNGYAKELIAAQTAQEAAVVHRSKFT